MTRSVRALLCTGASALALGGVGAMAQTILPTGTAAADTCTKPAGNNATVSVCADLTDIVVEILTPGRADRGPGNLTPNMQTCLGWDGRWVESNSCT